MRLTLLRQFMHFCAVGLAGLAVDTALLYLVAPLLGWYSGRLLSFLCAATATWALNRRFTFEDAAPHSSSQPLARQYLHYLAAMTLGGLVNLIAYIATLHFVPVAGAAALGVAVGSCAGLTFNFLTARLWVFRSQKQKAAPPAMPGA